MPGPDPSLGEGQRVRTTPTGYLIEEEHMVLGLHVLPAFLSLLPRSQPPKGAALNKTWAFHLV